MFDQVASATVQVVRGSSTGSGFRFLTSDTILTNQHVLDGNTGPIVVRAADGREAAATEIASSPANEYDFAILKTEDQKSSDYLEPSDGGVPGTGIEVAFAGFPHGVNDLIVQRAFVAGTVGDGGFYLDGSVNGGNSGGPVVHGETGRVVGIVTASRFLYGDDLDEMAKQAEELVEHSRRLQGGGSVVIMGIDFGSFAGMVGLNAALIRRLIKANANTGLGIGYPIDHALSTCRQNGIGS